MPKTIYAPDSLSLKPDSGATEGVLDKGVLGHPAYWTWAGLMGYEDTKTEYCTRVRMGLSLAWETSLCNPRSSRCLYKRPCVTLDPPGVDINDLVQP